MLASTERVNVLRDILNITKPSTHVLIADEKSNIPEFNIVFEKSQWEWTTTLAQKGFLFMLRQ